MKSSLKSATLTLKGFAGWISKRREWALSNVDDAPEPNAVRVCGRCATVVEAEMADRDAGDDRRASAPRDRWSPGLSMDNFS
ncbi:MAG TPA: hypothetical protein VM620_08240 [Hyphomicrobium sp.]|jgi:hypothetical protein|nr:hypothetical protein [Hyphomicrobium sp.]